VRSPARRLAVAHLSGHSRSACAAWVDPERDGATVESDGR
jgi:hypothetical protein